MASRTVIVVEGDQRERRAICALLEKLDCLVVPLRSMDELGSQLGRLTAAVLVLDLDALPVDSAFFRALKAGNPDMRVIGISDKPHHPELGEAFATTISAAVSKPAYTEELSWWVRSLLDN